MSNNLTPEELAELAAICRQRITGMKRATWRRYVELRQKERGEQLN